MTKDPRSAPVRFRPGRFVSRRRRNYGNELFRPKRQAVNALGKFVSATPGTPPPPPGAPGRALLSWGNLPGVSKNVSSRQPAERLQDNFAATKDGIAVTARP
jgi:hypothetical protein